MANSYCLGSETGHRAISTNPLAQSVRLGEDCRQRRYAAFVAGLRRSCTEREGLDLKVLEGVLVPFSSVFSLHNYKKTYVKKWCFKIPFISSTMTGRSIFLPSVMRIGFGPWSWRYRAEVTLNCRTGESCDRCHAQNQNQTHTVICISEIMMMQIAVPESLTKTFAVDYLWYNETRMPREGWRRLVYYSQRVEDLPPELNRIEQSDLLIGYIASGTNRIINPGMQYG